jgi:hypothetical protein
LLGKFLSIFEEVRVTLDRDLYQIFSTIIHELKANFQSFKSFKKESIVFGQQIDLDEESVVFPDGDFERITSENINDSTSSITFPGFPLNEPINNYLLDAINEYFIEEIEIFCWPIEGELTYKYILNRLKSGYFTDNIPESWMFPQKLLIHDKENIQEELQKVLAFDLQEQNGKDEINFETEEQVLRKISTFKYSAYQSSSSSDSNGTVNCNIIDLDRSIYVSTQKQHCFSQN